MYAVSVIPENSEILGSGLESCKALYCFIGICVSVGVGVHRYAPDSLNGGIVVYKLLNHIHIRTLRSHGNIYHFDTECLGDAEMSVIAGNRAKELYLIALAPGLCAAIYAELHCSCNGIIHKSKAGITAYDYHGGVNAQQVCKKLLSLGDTCEEAVIADINAVSVDKRRAAVENVEHRHAHIKLLLAGFTS